MRRWLSLTKIADQCPPTHFRCSTYDFGYMLKVLTNMNLPSEEADFFDMLKIYFPNIYDVKYLMKSCKNLKGGLQEVADQLEVKYVTIIVVLVMIICGRLPGMILCHIIQ